MLQGVFPRNMAGLKSASVEAYGQYSPADYKGRFYTVKKTLTLGWFPLEPILIYRKGKINPKTHRNEV